MLSFESQPTASLLDIETERNVRTLRAYEMSAPEYEVSTPVDLFSQVSSVGWNWIDAAMHLRAPSPDITHLPILEIGSATGRSHWSGIIAKRLLH